VGSKTREERILEMVMAPGFICKPSVFGDRVIVIDGRTGLDACERTASEGFDVLLDEIDGAGSPGRIGFGMTANGPTLVQREPVDPDELRAALATATHTKTDSGTEGSAEQ
jgi:hypothetical protein